jgi:peptidoglycan/LPS O-acetylase OafA/YrhL
MLDLLRAVAVFAVLIFHYGFRGAAGADGFTAISLPALAPYAKYGFLGVQMFFVISGFVIAYSTEQRSAIEFAIARVSRIYPGFLVCMTLTFLMTLAFGAPHFQVTFVQWLANFAIVAPAVKQPFMDGAYWSLVYEITFYAWVAALMMFRWYRRGVDVIVLAWMALAVANQELGSGILLRLFLTDQSGFFAAGLLLYEMHRGRRDLTVKLLLALAAVVAVGQSLQSAGWNRSHYGVAYENWIVAAIALSAITAVALAVRVHRVPLPASVVFAIGGITYPLYLLHQNVGYIVFNRLEGAAPSWLLITVTAAGMVGLTWALWRFIERPGQRFTKRVLSLVAVRLGRAVTQPSLGSTSSRAIQPSRPGFAAG